MVSCCVKGIHVNLPGLHFIVCYTIEYQGAERRTLMMSVQSKEDRPAGGEVTVTIDEMLCFALYTASRVATDIYSVSPLERRHAFAIV